MSYYDDNGPDDYAPRPAGLGWRASALLILLIVLGTVAIVMLVTGRTPALSPAQAEAAEFYQ